MIAQFLLHIHVTYLTCNIPFTDPIGKQQNGLLPYVWLTLFYSSSAIFILQLSLKVCCYLFIHGDGITVSNAETLSWLSYCHHSDSVWNKKILGRWHPVFTLHDNNLFQFITNNRKY